MDLLMSGIPAWLLRTAGQDISIEAFTGSSPFGPTYAAAVTERALVERKRRLVRNTEGAEVISETTLRMRLGATCPPESRVTLADGTQSFVITSGTHDGGSLPVPSHTEITLQ